MEDFDNTMEIVVQKEKKQLIENVELRNYIQSKIDKDNITMEDLENIDEIIIDSENIIGQHNEVYFQEIELFPKLEKITIRNLGISTENMKRLINIKQIKFKNCEINDITQLHNVRHLEIIHSEIEGLEELVKLSELKELQLIDMKVDNFEFLKELKQLEKLVIKNVEQFSLEKINFELPIEYLSIEKIDKLDLDMISKYKNLKTLSIDRTESENWEEELENLRNRNIEILLNDMYEY